MQTSPHDRLLMAIFGGELPADDQAEIDAAQARQAEKDWAEAEKVAALAAEFFPDQEWAPALGFGWQPCAVSARDDGTVVRANRYEIDGEEGISQEPLTFEGDMRRLVLRS